MILEDTLNGRESSDIAKLSRKGDIQKGQLANISTYWRCTQDLLNLVTRNLDVFRKKCTAAQGTNEKTIKHRTLL
tara:strand:- start:58 stop:282 length:225 start_codon:yes stop_codon:yes gene_type:complete